MKKKKTIAVLLIITIVLALSCTASAGKSEGNDDSIRWHAVGTAGEPAFQNGWGNYNSTIQSLQFGVDNEGFLHIVGSIEDSTPNTTAQTIFTLPPGFRPSISQYVGVDCFVTGTGTIIAPVLIYPTGLVALGANTSIAHIGHISVKL